MRECSSGEEGGFVMFSGIEHTESSLALMKMWEIPFFDSSRHPPVPENPNVRNRPDDSLKSEV